MQFIFGQTDFYLSIYYGNRCWNSILNVETWKIQQFNQQTKQMRSKMIDCHLLPNDILDFDSCFQILRIWHAVRYNCRFERNDRSIGIERLLNIRLYIYQRS